MFNDYTYLKEEYIMAIEEETFNEGSQESIYKQKKKTKVDSNQDMYLELQKLNLENEWFPVMNQVNN